MIISELYKSYSVFTPDEFEKSLARDLEDMTDQERGAFYTALIDSDFESSLSSLELRREIIPVSEWLDDDYYMGEEGKSLYPAWREDLIELFESDNYQCGVIVGGIGSGKSNFSQLAVLRMVYEASCLVDPARSYGIASNSTIGFCNLAKSKETSRRVVFEGIGAKLANSPYFKYEFAPLKNVKNEIIFPNKITILAGSSTDTSIIGMNIFGGIFDEGNFMGGAKKKKHNMAEQKRWGQQGKAGRLFEAVMRRMKSRYLKKGNLPGCLLVVSSKTTHDSFTEQLIRKDQAKGVTTTFVRDRNIIEVKRDHFDDSVFRVVVGDETFGSKILSEDEDEGSYVGATIIEVPTDFRNEFEDDLDGSLRDIAGVSTVAISQFINKPNKVDDMIDDRSHPFSCPLLGDSMQWDSLLPYKIHWDRIANRLPTGEWEPKLNPYAKRHVSMDPALTGDAFGLAIVHIAGTIPVLVRGTHDIYEQEPYFVVDFVLSIQGEPGEEVIFKNVRQLCYEFSYHGYHLAEFSTDTYQSREMLQALREQGFRAGLYSVDTGIGVLPEDWSETMSERQMEGSGESKRKQAYRYLRRVIYEDRIRTYDYPILIREIKQLEDTPRMVDHPGENGSKDVADAVAGAVWTLFRADYNLEPIGMMLGISEPPLSANIYGHDVDENFDQVRRVHGDIQVSDNLNPPGPSPRVYQKKKPKTLAPTYKKIAHDGTEEDLTWQEPDIDNFIARG